METGKKANVTVRAVIQAPVEKVWTYWTEPEHITKWNQATDDWHAPWAKNDLRPGGKFVTRMEAKDGSAGFDFSGTYDVVNVHEEISYTLDDGRKVHIGLFARGNETEVVEMFEAEGTHPVEYQRAGWQAIMDRFKTYAESRHRDQAGQAGSRAGKIVTFLWFDDQAEEAVNFYASLFEDAKIVHTTYLTASVAEAAGKKPGDVSTIEFELNGQRFAALNGGPLYKFSEAISIAVYCKTQEEIDRLWDALSEGGEVLACGWLKDRFGVTWQIVPEVLDIMMRDPDPVKADRVARAMLGMEGKLIIRDLERAYNGE